MKVKITVLLGSVILLAVLLAVYFALTSKKTENKPTENNAVTEDSLGKKLSPNESADEIVVSNENGNYDFVKEKENWVLKGYENVILSDEEVSSLVQCAENLYAVETIEENPQNVDKYGLKTPLAQVIVKKNNKSIFKFNIGNLSADNKYTYVQTDENLAVYLANASACEIFKAGIKDFTDKNVNKIDTNSVIYMEIDYKNKDDILVEYDKNNSLVKEYADKNGLATLVLRKPVSDIVVYPYSLQATVLENVSLINISDLADPKPENLSKYGLDQPEMTVILKDRENSLILKVGSEAPSDDENYQYRYVKINDRNEVFTIDERALDSFFNADIVDFVQPFVSLHSRSSLNKIQAEYGDKKFTVEFKSQGENTFTENEEGVVRDNRNAYVNNNIIKRELFSPFYENIVGLSFDSILKENADIKGSAEAVITYFMKDGSKEKVEFYNYDDSYFVAKKGESATLIVNKQSVRKLFLDAEKVQKGESVENTNKEKAESE